MSRATRILRLAPWQVASLQRAKDLVHKAEIESVTAGVCATFVSHYATEKMRPKDARVAMEISVGGGVWGWRWATRLSRRATYCLSPAAQVAFPRVGVAGLFGRTGLVRLLPGP